jgi:hypothetical protein
VLIVSKKSYPVDDNGSGFDCKTTPNSPQKKPIYAIRIHGESLAKVGRHGTCISFAETQ